MSKKLIKSETTVIVRMGVPYSLVKEDDPSNNEVCEKCALRNICSVGDKIGLLQPMCWDEFNDSAWYFVEDWDIMNYKVRDYVDIEIVPEQK